MTDTTWNGPSSGRVGPLLLELWLRAKRWPTLTSQPRTWPGSMGLREEGVCQIFKVSASFTCLFIHTMYLVVSSLFCRWIQLKFRKSRGVAVGCFQTVFHLPHFSTPVSYQYPFYKSFLGYHSSMEFDSDRWQSKQLSSLAFSYSQGPFKPYALLVFFSRRQLVSEKYRSQPNSDRTWFSHSAHSMPYAHFELDVPVWPFAVWITTWKEVIL